MSEVIDKLNFNVKNSRTLQKFYTTMFLVSEEKLLTNINALAEFNVKLTKSSQIKVLLLETDDIIKRLNYALEEGFLDKISENPIYVLDSTIFNKTLVANARDNAQIIKIEEILSKPLTTLLDIEDYPRYDNLISMVIPISDQMSCDIFANRTDIGGNIMKLIVSDIKDDFFVLRTAISFNNNLSSEEMNELNLSIKNCFAKKEKTIERAM